MNIKDFGAYLVEKGLIAAQTLEKAKKEAARRKESLEFILLDTGVISERNMAEAMGSAFEFEFIDLDEVDVDEKTARTVPEHMALRYRAVPVKKDRNMLILAMADPTDVTAIDDFKLVSGCGIRPVIATTSAIMRQLMRCFRGEVVKPMKAPSQEDIIYAADMKVSPEKLLKLIDEPPVVRVVSLIISKAIEDGASEIIITPEETTLTVSYMINDLLYQVLSPPLHIHQPVLARLRLMAGLDPSDEKIGDIGVITLQISDSTFMLSLFIEEGERGEVVKIRIIR